MLITAFQSRVNPHMNTCSNEFGDARIKYFVQLLETRNNKGGYFFQISLCLADTFHSGILGIPPSNTTHILLKGIQQSE